MIDRRWIVIAIATTVALAACKKDKGGGATQQDFEDYSSRAKLSEAELMLNKLGKTLKVYAIQQGTVPVGKAPLTPATPCCSMPEHMCAVDPNNWTGEPWATLEFQVDEPHRFQYDYASDGKTFTAHAVGDLGCNGKTTTLTLTGGLDANGGVTTSID